MFVSGKMELFVESIISHEMHCQLCWIVARMVLLDSKNIADAIVCVCVKSYCGICLSKTSYLIQRRHIACSLASVRVKGSVCQPVKGSRLEDIVRWHSYGDISSITTYCVAAAKVSNSNRQTLSHMLLRQCAVLLLGQYEVSNPVLQGNECMQHMT